MKRGYQRLLVFELLLVVLFFLNSFVSSILGDYLKVLLLIAVLITFYFTFGFEKDRHHLWKTVCIEVLIFILFYFLLYYLSGLFLSFTKTINYYNVNGIFKIILPLIIIIVLKEVLRYMILVKSEGSKLLVVTTCIAFILIDIFDLIRVSSFSTAYTTFIFIALYLLPTISKNVLCTYISVKVGYKPVILYLIVMDLYSYFIPIIPNPNEYIYSVIHFVVPFVLMYRLYMLFKKDTDEYVLREYNKKRIGHLILPGLVVLFLVYITSGYFHYHAIVIASGSMVPNIYKGDVVVIEKIEGDYDLLNLNQVIAYKYNDIIIVHRLVKIVDVDGERFYYTKGDANNAMDNYAISKDMILGVVNVKVPYIGYPTVWLKNL